MEFVPGALAQEAALGHRPLELAPRRDAGAPDRRGYGRRAPPASCTAT
jgi:hypothetical protein